MEEDRGIEKIGQKYKNFDICFCLLFNCHCTFFLEGSLGTMSPPEFTIFPTFLTLPTFSKSQVIIEFMRPFICKV